MPTLNSGKFSPNESMLISQATTKNNKTSNRYASPVKFECFFDPQYDVRLSYGYDTSIYIYILHHHSRSQCKTETNKQALRVTLNKTGLPFSKEWWWKSESIYGHSHNQHSGSCRLITIWDSALEVKIYGTHFCANIWGWKCKRW